MFLVLGLALYSRHFSLHQLQNQMELQASTAERAAFFLDAALAARRSSRTPDDQEARRNSHFLFTLHLCQERLDKSSKAAGQCPITTLATASCESLAAN